MRPALLLAALLCCAASCAVEPSDARCLSDAPCQEVVCAPEVNFDCEFKRGNGTVERQCDGTQVLYDKDDGHKSYETMFVCGVRHGIGTSFNGDGSVGSQRCWAGGAADPANAACPTL